MAGQSGDRELVVARLRRRASPPPANVAHPHPGVSAAAPEPRSRLLDGEPDLAEVFARTAAEADCTVHRASGPAEAAEVVAAIARSHGAQRAVATGEEDVLAAVDALRAGGVAVADAADRDAAAAADLGLTGCRAAVASTGSVVVASDVPGARWASLLPRVHACIVPAGAVVASPGDVLRPLTAPLPAAVAFVTGPSRTGDIEQLLTRGVHGPVAVEIVLVDAP